MMTSTLIETVSINYEDFNESFLTCGTCLCLYDGGEHTPKLLPCSHTVCRQCLDRITASQASRDSGTFRCPICRETIVLPRGGVGALPPSFLVNQLLDLMARQRREVVPKCSMHFNEELLFCETCDCVFCSVCTGGLHDIATQSSPTGSATSAVEHTVIPFSIAIKRMSEILLYKAQQCVNKLNAANDSVMEEMHKLDHNVDNIFEHVNRSFQEVMNVVERRRQEVFNQVKKARDEKKRVLNEQLSLINGEKQKVDAESEGMQYQVEVRNITKKIGELNEKMDSVGALAEPRENAYINYEYDLGVVTGDVQRAVAQFGCLKTSTTFPALCTVQLQPDIPVVDMDVGTSLVQTHEANVTPKVAAYLKQTAVVTTVDYHGDNRCTGLDPVTVKLIQTDSNSEAEIDIQDNGDGTYRIDFVAPSPGSYKLYVQIFDRPTKNSPLLFEAVEHINPIAHFGTKGNGIHNLNQPVGIATDSQGLIYVTDTANSRIKVLDSSLTFVSHITGVGLEDRGGTGIATIEADDGRTHLLVSNWRTKSVTELAICDDRQTEVIRKFTSDLFVEPIAVAVNKQGLIYLADAGAQAVFVCERGGTIRKKISGRRRSGASKTTAFNLLSSVCVGPADEIVVIDADRIAILNTSGYVVRTVTAPDHLPKGRYGGVEVVTTEQGVVLLASRTDKGSGSVHVYDFDTLLFKCVIVAEQSCEHRLKRPCGLVVMSSQVGGVEGKQAGADLQTRKDTGPRRREHVLVVDLGNDSVKMFRFR